MGRIPTFVIIIVGVVLILGVSALMYFMMLTPQKAELTDAEKNLKAEQEMADALPDAEAGLAKVKAEWKLKNDELDALSRERSIPISFAHPAAAMVALWYEYIQDLAPLIEHWVENTGCTIESGASLPAPAMTPPTPPSNGIMQIPDGQTITLTVSGNLASLERLYRSLDQFKRIVTLNQLVITAGQGDTLRAQIPLKFYLLVEVPPSMIVAAPTGGGGGMSGPEGMGGPEGMPGGEPGMNGEAPPGDAAASGSGAAAPATGDGPQQ